MLPRYQKYLNNLTVVHRLMRPVFSASLSEYEIIDAVHKNAEHLSAIHHENDAILEEILFSRTPEALTAEEASALMELADALFNYNRSPDVGISYRIHQLLYGYALLRNDTDMIIRELYYQGITLFYLNVSYQENGINLFVDQIGEYFRKGASYFEQYETLQSSETRAFVIRCIGNVKYGMRSIRGGEGDQPRSLLSGWDDYEKIFHTVMSILNSPRYRQMDPSIPWDNLCYMMHFDRLYYLAGLRDGKKHPDVAKAVLESAEYVYRHQEQIAAAGERTVGIRTQYVYAAARYHNGLIPLEELVDVLLSICDAAPLNNFSGDTIWAVLNCPEYIKFYVQGLSPDQQEALAPHIQQLVDKQTEYLFSMPPNEYSVYISRIFQTTAEHAAKRDSHFSERLLDYVLACHPPTFVHSEVVAMLTRWFCEHIAQMAPHLLDGACGMEHPAENADTLDALLDKSYRAGLYHDIGKCMLLSYIGQYSRRLLEEEFLCIKLHPLFGCTLLRTLGMDDLASAAELHHRTFDHHGYPPRAEDCPHEMTQIVNIITVADSLDAGTDNIGRSYAASKTYETLVEELRAGKGTRYAPEIVALFDDVVFYADTRRFLRESRRRAYLKAYGGQ